MKKIRQRPVTSRPKTTQRALPKRPSRRLPLKEHELFRRADEVLARVAAGENLSKPELEGVVGLLEQMQQGLVHHVKEQYAHIKRHHPDLLEQEGYRTEEEFFKLQLSFPKESR